MEWECQRAKRVCHVVSVASEQTGSWVSSEQIERRDSVSDVMVVIIVIL